MNRQRIVIGFLLLLALALTAPSFAAPQPFVSPLPIVTGCQFYTVEVVYGWDFDPDLGRYVTWGVYLRGSNGYGYIAKTWWPHYQPGDVIRLCDGESFPWGEWQHTYLPLLRK